MKKKKEKERRSSTYDIFSPFRLCTTHEKDVIWLSSSQSLFVPSFLRSMSSSPRIIVVFVFVFIRVVIVVRWLPFRALNIIKIIRSLRVVEVSQKMK